MLYKSIKRESIAFCNASWRNFIADICRQIDKNELGLQIISPFGFELLEDKKFLYKSIKRFYCYIGIPGKNAFGCDPIALSKEFLEKLMASIHEIGMRRSDIAILVAQDKFTYFHENNYQCNNSDKLLDVQTKIIKDDLLRDYANYIICTVDSICSKKEEPRHFFENKRHRCRTYQLYVMLEKIFGYLLSPMTPFQKENFFSLFKLIDNSIQMFYTPSELLINASEYEVHTLRSLINPRVELMRQAIQVASCSSDLMKLQCEAYHVEGALELTIHKTIYENAVKKICSTYINFY